jgi:indolepyruvate ferredoxin oxidoreductase, beta subunit
MQKWQALQSRLAAMPADVAELARHGLRKVVEFQDLDYGAAYVARLEAILKQDRAPFTFSREAAKYVANAMAYDDVIRVADLKTRAGRSVRIAREMGAKDSNVMQVTEFLHPRAEEIVGMLPAKLGARLQADPKWMARIDRWFNKGRRLRTDSLGSFLMLYVVGGLKRRRPGSLRHAQEVAHLEGWLAKAQGYFAANYDLAVEVLRCRRLVKGYSDTHARGLSKFDRVLEGVALVAGRDDAADWARRLREAALQDEQGKALDGALATVRSFV